MFTFAALANQPVSDQHGPLISRLIAALSDLAILHIVPYESLPQLAMRAHTGTKYSFWPCIDESGIMVNINPNAGNLSKLAMTKVNGYMTLSRDDKMLAMSALAALYGLSGTESSRCKFVITYDPTFTYNYLPLKIALNLGIKVFNLAVKDDLIALTTLVKTLRDRAKKRVA